MNSDLVIRFADFKRRQEHGDVFLKTEPDELLSDTLIDNPDVIGLPQDFQEILESIEPNTPLPELWKKISLENPILDANAFDEWFEQARAVFSALNPKGILGQEIKPEVLKLLEEAQENIAQRLAFKRTGPMESDSDLGGSVFHWYAKELMQRCYQKTITITQSAGKDFARIIRETKALKT